MGVQKIEITREGVVILINVGHIAVINYRCVSSKPRWEGSNEHGRSCVGKEREMLKYVQNV